VKGQRTDWRDCILFDDLNAALLDLMALEESCIGEPKWHPYKQAADSLWTLMDTLKTQSENAGKNAYYTQAKGA
jgi:hypothetical protein